MSGVPTVNVVDDEEMSSQGSVNAPVAPPQSPTAQAPTQQVQTGLPSWSAIAHGALTQGSRVAGTSRPSGSVDTTVAV